MPFTADQIITLALNPAGNRAGDTALTAAAESELQLLIFELEEDPSPYWFQLSEWSTANLIADSNQVQLPTDFLMEDEDSHLFLLDISGATVRSRLEKDDSDALRLKYLNGGSSTPKYYAITGEYFELFPTPSRATFQLEMRYYKRATDLTETIRENVWTVNGPDLLIAMLGQKIINGYLQENNAASASLEKAEARARRRLRTKHVAREVANMDMEMGD